MGQMSTYSEVSSILEKLLRTAVSSSQVYRLTDYYGSAIEEPIKEDFEKIESSKQDIVYGQMDGGMIFTDDGWQEVKVGRIFLHSDLVKISKTDSKRKEIKRSQYVARLGSHKPFLESFGKAIQPYKNKGERLVFINDGARWIDRWIKEHFPEATSILDYFHAIENIARVGKVLLSTQLIFERWLDNHKERLLESKIDEVINSILKLSTKNTTEEDMKTRLLGYIKRNENRMDYKLYRANGLQIGSGAIEAAHRTVVQARMKKSGQRWTDSGAQNMLNLRVAYKSNKWELVKNNICSASAA